MDGNLIIADADNHCIRKMAPSDSLVSTVAGSRAGGAAGKGFADGEAAAARFNLPRAVAVDGNNAILVADAGNQLRLIASEGAQVTTLAGSSRGKVDGEGANTPRLLALEKCGRLLAADLHNASCLRVAEVRLRHVSQ